MVEKVGDICFKVGTYERNGETKTRYKNGGVLFKGEDGSFYGIIEMLPVGFEGRFSVFGEKRGSDPRKPASQPEAYQSNPPDDDIPF